MFPVLLKPGIRFMLFEDTYQILKKLPNLKVQVEKENFNVTQIFTQAELITALSNGDLKFECTGKNLSKTSGGINTSYALGELDVSSFKEEAIFRYEVIKPLLELSEQNAISRADEVNSWSVNPKKAKRNLNDCLVYHTVSSQSIYRWLKAYKESCGDIRSLLPSYHNCGGKGNPRISPKINEFINEAIDLYYNKQQRISIKELWLCLTNMIAEHNRFSVIKLDIPPYPTLARYVSKIPEYQSIASRYSKRSADYKFKVIGNGVETSFPLERVEIDHTPVDIIIKEDNGTEIGRPFLVLAIDKYTRNALGFSLGLSNGVGWPEVSQCIKSIMTDKSYVKDMYPFIENEWNAFGVPKTLVIDNGLEFKNSSMKDTCYQLGIVLRICPPKVPEWKGSIERFFGTTNTSLVHNLPGTTRSNPTKLDSDENPSALATLTFSQFNALLHKWIIDVYSQDFHKGVGGIPSKLWKKAIGDYPVSWPNSSSDIVTLLGRTAQRKISNRGIEINCLHYNGNNLNRLLMQFSKENKGLEEDFTVKYDPYNLRELFVYDHVITKEWIKVPCTNPQYATNLSEWEHKEMRAYARKEYGIVDYESLARAKHMIRTMIENNIGYTPKEKARANKINADEEINKARREVESASNILYHMNALSEDNISDIGITIATPKIIIPESLVSTEESKQDDNIINIKQARKEKARGTKKQLSSNEIQLLDGKKDKPLNDNICMDDFSGFSILTDF
jgi:putative transposase